jgi:hypothetical protein
LNPALFLFSCKSNAGQPAELLHIPVFQGLLSLALKILVRLALNQPDNTPDQRHKTQNAKFHDAFLDEIKGITQYNDLQPFTNNILLYRNYNFYIPHTQLQTTVNISLNFDPTWIY